MNRSIYILLLFFGCFYLQAQDCDYPNEFMGQQTIDDFAINYPGCTVINNGFRISPTVTNLEGLAQIKEIKGDLFIDCNVTDLNGLQNLEKVGGNLNISRNASLTNLSHLSSLKYVEDNLLISFNPLIKNLDGLQNLERVYFLTIDGNNDLEEIRNLNKTEYLGQLNIEANQSLHTISGFDALDTIQEFFFLEYRNTSLVEINGFNELDYLGNMEVKELNIKNIRGFSQLNTIERHLKFEDCPALELVEGFQNLKRIGDELVVQNNVSLMQINGFDLLAEIDGDMVVIDNPNLISLSSFKDLSSVKYINLRDNPSLQVLFPDANLASLESIEVINAAIPNLAGLNTVGEKLLFVRLEELALLVNVNELASVHTIDDLWITNCASLSSIEGLQSLSQIDATLNLSNLPSLTSLSGLERLENVQDDFILSGIEADNLLPLQSLRSVMGNFTFGSFSKLKNLSGLENLNYVGKRLAISGNNTLNSIQALENLEPNSIEWLQIYKNPELTQCGIVPFCELLYKPNTFLFIAENKFGCNHPNEIRCLNSGFSGIVFYDLNQNGIQDTLEAGMPNIFIDIPQLNSNVLSNTNGQFYFEAEEGQNYDLIIDDQTTWSVTTGNQNLNLTFVMGADENDKISIGLYPKVIEHQGQTSITSLETRCNTPAEFFLKYLNTGNFLEDGNIQFNLDPNTSFVRSSITPDQISPDGKTIMWNFDSLYPYECRQIDLLINMPDETFTGEIMEFKSIINFDGVILDNEESCYRYEPLVLCSYDPNDIFANPPGIREDHETLIGTDMTYTIRFQNTGNASAIDVKIINDLDENLDIETFRLLNSSFPVQVKIENREVEFRFDNIRLPDSLSNEPASHGFINYYIETLADIKVGTRVENTANIFFDFNPAIVTNTAFNTFVDETTSVEANLATTDPIMIFPNPVDDYLTISYPARFTEVKIYNLSGQEIYTGQTDKIKVSDFINGVYFLRITAPLQMYTKKIVIQH